MNGSITRSIYRLFLSMQPHRSSDLKQLISWKKTWQVNCGDRKTESNQRLQQKSASHWYSCCSACWAAVEPDKGGSAGLRMIYWLVLWDSGWGFKTWGFFTHPFRIYVPEENYLMNFSFYSTFKHGFQQIWGSVWFLVCLHFILYLKIIIIM